MNIAEHPQALDLLKRLSATEEKGIPAQVFFPGIGQMMGIITQAEIPGLFTLSSKVKIEGTGQEGIMEFSFTADKPVAIIHPDLSEKPEKSRIIQ